MDDSFRSGSPGDLVVLTTHPVQYHAPVYRFLRERRGVSIKVIYASDFSVVGYRDKEFGTSFAWDTPLADPEYSIFLSRVADGGRLHSKRFRPAVCARRLPKRNPMLFC